MTTTSYMNAFSSQAVQALGTTNYNLLQAEISKSPTLMNMLSAFAAAGGTINVGVATSNGSANSDFAFSTGGGTSGNSPVCNISAGLLPGGGQGNNASWTANFAEGLAHEIGQFNNSYASQSVNGVNYVNGLAAGFAANNKTYIDNTYNAEMKQEGYGNAYEYEVTQELSKQDNTSYKMLSGDKVQAQMTAAANQNIGATGQQLLDDLQPAGTSAYVDASLSAAQDMTASQYYYLGLELDAIGMNSSSIDWQRLTYGALQFTYNSQGAITGVTGNVPTKGGGTVDINSLSGVGTVAPGVIAASSDQIDSDNEGELTNSNGQLTDVITWNAQGYEIADAKVNSAGLVTTAYNFVGTATNNYETDQINYSTLYGVEASDYQFNSAGKETDAIYYAGTATNNYETNQYNFSTTNGAETSNVIFNSSSQLTEEQLFAGTATGNYETDQVNFSTLYGVETSDYQFNSAGKETDGIYFTGTATNNYETNQVNYSTANGAETSNYQYNSSGKETDDQVYAGTATGNYMTNQYNFSLSNGAVTSNYQFNSSSKETDEQDFVGTTTNNYETNQYNFSLSNGAIVSNYQFNASGQETGQQNFAGTTSNNYVTDQISFSTLNGLETSDLQYNSAGKETDGIYFSGTSGNNYETNQANFSTSNGAETSNVEFNSSGQETEFLQYAGTTTGNYVTEIASFTPSATYSSEIDQYNSAGKETQQDLFNSTTGHENSAMLFNTSTGLESQYDQFSSSGSYANQITLFNTAGKESENETFNAISGAVSSLFLFDGVDPYATEELFSTGGSYFSQIDYFNASTGVQSSGAMFNTSTGAETEYFSSGSWYSGGSGSSDSSDTGYYDDEDFDDDDSWFDDDPVVLNLNGGAVQTTALAGSQANFDLLSDGQPVQTGWGTAGEGYLVYDPNDPGNTTAVTQGSQLVAGMGALNSLAQQVDGVGESELTSSDALWSDLKVWVDTTGTGQFQSGQLYSLGQLGISSLNLQGTMVNQNDNGNQIVVQGTFGFADGTTGQMAGVNLAYSGVGMSGLTADQSAADSDDVSLSPLIAAMASYAVPASTSAGLAATLQPDVSATLAACAH